MASVVTSLMAEDIIKQLDTYSKDIIAKLDQAIEETARAIEEKAVMRAPVDDVIGNSIRNGITVSDVGEHGKAISSNSVVSAYYEFGTGVYVFEETPGLPTEIKDYALTFYVNGRGTIRQHPYLFNSYLEEKEKLIEKAKDIISG